MIKQKITNCLWFDSEALEAAKYYVSIFKNSKILQITHYDEASSKVSGQKKGSILTVLFILDGQKFMALNGGPIFKFNEAMSLMVDCKDQKEVDYYWKKLSSGGEVVECGWLKDKYGVSWQVVPTELNKLISSKNKVKSERAMQAMIKMKKLDINIIKKAYNQK